MHHLLLCSKSRPITAWSPQVQLILNSVLHCGELDLLHLLDILRQLGERVLLVGDASGNQTHDSFRAEFPDTREWAGITSVVRNVNQSMNGEGTC
jgi:hypothetical protein